MCVLCLAKKHEHSNKYIQHSYYWLLHSRTQPLSVSANSTLITLTAMTESYLERLHVRYQTGALHPGPEVGALCACAQPAIHTTCNTAALRQWVSAYGSFWKTESACETPNLEHLFYNFSFVTLILLSHVVIDITNTDPSSTNNKIIACYYCKNLLQQVFKPVWLQQ